MSYEPKNELTSAQALEVQKLEISGEDVSLYALSEAATVGPSLGSAQNYAVLAGSTVTNTGSSVVTGDLGVSPGTAVVGFPPGVVNSGSIHSNDASAQQAQIDLTAAYIALAALAPTANLTGQDLGTVGTLTAGVYKFNTSAQLTGTLTLDFQNNPSALFVFQMGSTLTTASSSSVVMLNGGKAGNIFWQVGSSATIGTSTTFKGNIVALTSITVNTSASVAGKTLARNGAVTLDTNAVNSSESATGVGGNSLIALIREPVKRVYLAQMKDNAANAYAQFAQSSISIVDSSSFELGGNKGAIKIDGLSSLADNDCLSLNYSVE